MNEIYRGFISLIAVIFWNAAKLIRRRVGLLRIRNLSYSLTKSFDKDLFRVSYTEESITNFNYKSQISSKRAIYSILDVVVNPKTGVVRNQFGIIEESTIWPIHALLLWEPRPWFTNQLSGSYVNLPDNGYFHFLCEDLPRFLEVTNYGNDSDILIGSNSPYILDTLRIMSLEKYQLIKSPVKVDSLRFSQKLAGGIFTRSDLSLLKSFQDLIPNQNIEKTKIFIDRKDTNKDIRLSRGIVFQDQVRECLKSEGFEELFLEDLTLPEQVRKFNSADVVVGFHGAGLANLVWCKEGVRVIELTGTRITNHFSHLAEVNRLQYSLYNVENFLSNFSPKIL